MFTAVLAAVLAAAPGPQSAARPNFSGHWIGERDASQQMSITHTEAALTTSHGSEGGHHTLTFRMDGKPADVRIGEGEHAVVFVTRARWEGTTLVLEQMPSESQEGVRIKQVWTLLQDGRLEVAIDAIEADGEAHNMKIVFKRKQ